MIFGDAEQKSCGEDKHILFTVDIMIFGPSESALKQRAITEKEGLLGLRDQPSIGFDYYLYG